jgi:hypothetical protein
LTVRGFTAGTVHDQHCALLHVAILPTSLRE